MDAEELQAPTTCNTLNRLLNEVRLKSSKRWMIRERGKTIKSFFTDPTVVKSYELYTRESSDDAWSSVNFYTEGTDSSVQASVIIAYFYGVLAGLQDKKEAVLGNRIGGIC